MSNTIAETVYANPSNPISGQFWFLPNAGTVPNAVTNASAAPGATQCVVTWTASVADATHAAPTSYRIFYGTDNPPTTDAGIKSSGDAITGLTNGVLYYFKVRAVNTAGSTDSSVVSATPTNVPIGVTFALPATSASKTVAVTTLAATDSVGVVGWRITESATPPAHDAAADAQGNGWNTVSSTTSFTTSSATYVSDDYRTLTLYAWFKNAANNVSAALSGSNACSVLYSTTFTGSNGAAPDSAVFTVKTAGSGTVALDGSGNVKFDLPTGTDAGLLIRTKPIVRQQVRKYTIPFSASSVTAQAGILWAMDLASLPAIAGGTNYTGTKIRLDILDSGGSYYSRIVVNFAAGSKYWSRTAAEWVVPGSFTTNSTMALQVSLSTTYNCIFETTETQFRISIYDSTHTDTSSATGRLMQTAWANWSDLTIANSLYLLTGDPDERYDNATSFIASWEEA